MTTEEPHDKRIVRCAACKAEIIFLPTVTGKRMPVDAASVDAEDEVYEQGKHVNHWGTCTDPKRFKK